MAKFIFSNLTVEKAKDGFFNTLLGHVHIPNSEIDTLQARTPRDLPLPIRNLPILLTEPNHQACPGLGAAAHRPALRVVNPVDYTSARCSTARGPALPAAKALPQVGEHAMSRISGCVFAGLAKRGGRILFLSLLLWGLALPSLPAFSQGWQLTIENEGQPGLPSRSAARPEPTAEAVDDILKPAAEPAAQAAPKTIAYELTLLNRSPSPAGILLAAEKPGPDNILQPGAERKVRGKAPRGQPLVITALKDKLKLDTLKIEPPPPGKTWWVVLGPGHKLRLTDKKPGKKESGPVKADIGPAGGGLTLADGTRLVVPPGAFTGPTPVTMRRVEDSSGLLPPEPGLKRRVLELTAPVAKFKKPVQIRIPLQPEDKPSEADRFLVGVLDEKQNCLRMMPVGVEKTKSGSDLVITTDHFCFFFIDWIMGETPPPRPGPSGRPSTSRAIPCIAGPPVWKQS